jgi:hypothetical protein
MFNNIRSPYKFVIVQCGVGLLSMIISFDQDVKSSGGQLMLNSRG